MWSIGRDQPVIPGVAFIRWALATSFCARGSLTPAFASARDVSLAVKLAYAFALSLCFPYRASQPLNDSVTFLESTAPVKLPTRHCPFSLEMVRIKISTGWCYIVARRLPPTLYNWNINPISSCSKASRGLSVLLRVTGIFTGIVISPSLSQRQFSDRYAIRAGRNLHDKEIRLNLLRYFYIDAVISAAFYMSPYSSDHIFI